MHQHQNGSLFTVERYRCTCGICNSGTAINHAGQDTTQEEYNSERQTRKKHIKKMMGPILADELDHGK